MKRIVAYIGAYSFYWLGDLACLLSIRLDGLAPDSVVEWLCDAYQRNMSLSVRIQDWGGLEKPWTHRD